MTSGWPTKFPENGVYTKAVHNSDHPIMEFQIFEDLLEIAQRGLVCMVYKTKQRADKN